jgi:hypothetical protein
LRATESWMVLCSSAACAVLPLRAAATASRKAAMSAAEVESLAARENCGGRAAGLAAAVGLGAAALPGALPGRALGSGSPLAELTASRSPPVTKSALKARVGVCVIKVYAFLVWATLART